MSKVVHVDVKLAWPGEASDFTPWLLANSDALGDALGVDLELTAAEHKVGDFSLDLIGRDVADDSVVIVENQFGKSDHRHLGQLLTYAGGTEPTTVVWIAEDFRDDHRAALDWLNQRTDSDTRFFGVRLGAITLEGAPSGLIAPLLDLVVQPNDWGKAVRKTASEGSSEKQLRYQAFWTKWLEQTGPHNWTNRKPPAAHWLYLPAGSAGARYTVSFRSDGLLSELYFHHENPAVNLARWTALNERRTEIESAFGGPLEFDDLPNRIGCRIGVARHDNESVDDSASWADYLAWFEETQIKLRSAIAATGGIPPADLEVDDLDEGPEGT